MALFAYEAAAEPVLWPRFLELYSHAVSSDTIILQIHDLEDGRSNVVAGIGLDSPFKKAYNEHYSKLNVWRDAGRALYVPGTVTLDPEHCPRSILERSEFYNDYLRRCDLAHSMGAVIARSRNEAPTLSALRRHSRSPFGEAEREVAKFLLPYLSRAWTIYQRLDLLHAGESAMDTLPTGVVFLAASGTAIYWNRAADEMFRAADGLSLRNGVLCAADRRAAAQLRKAIRDASSPPDNPGHGAVSISRPSLRRDYQIAVAPLRAQFRQFTGTPVPVVLAIVTDPERQKTSSVSLLMRFYKLTQKEATLGGKLFEGKSLKQAAVEMSITYETARTHLRRIFGKTGTSRQAELLLLVDQLPVTVADEIG